MPATRAPTDPAGALRFAIAQRVADAHRGLDQASLLSFVSGSTVEGLADERSDVDMSVVFDRLPEEARLREACRTVGSDWFWATGPIADEGGVVAFHVDGIEVQIGYSSHAGLARELDQLVVEHDPDTPTHKLAEGLLKAVPLAGAERLEALKGRLAPFPAALGRAMAAHGLTATPTPWKAIAQIVHRDAEVWCRDLQVDACYRLLLALCGVNGRYFTRFQVKRMHRLVAQLPLAPASLAERIEALLAAPPAEAFAALHRLEGEVIDRVAARWPDLDLTVLRQRRAAFAPD